MTEQQKEKMQKDLHKLLEARRDLKSGNLDTKLESKRIQSTQNFTDLQKSLAMLKEEKTAA